MSKKKRVHALLDEISLLIKYAVPEDERQQALSFVKKNNQDNAVLALLREYYSTLPEAREESVVRVASLGSLQGVFLFVAVTKNEAYLYVVSGEKVVYLGEYGNEVDQQILSYFGYESQSAFLKKCLPVDQLEDYTAIPAEKSHECPVCAVAEGEYHLLGCAVEVCPWCDGQLSNCNCRFEQLGLDEIENEEQLDDFLELLKDKGRIPFEKDQAPSYPAAGDGPDNKQ